MTQDELKMVLEFVESINLGSRSASVEQQRQVVAVIKEALAQPDQYAKGYADAMNWKVQNHLEHLPTAQPEQEPVAWKLMPRDATNAMLNAMDECSTEEYDERLYAGHAASVYMAAWDEAPTPPQRTWVGLMDDEIDELHGSPMDLEHSGALKWVRIIEAKLKEKNT